MTLSADEDEHSIEMQLPYIAKVRKLVSDLDTILLIKGDGACQGKLHHCARDGGLTVTKF